MEPFNLGLTLQGSVLNGKPIIDFWIETLGQPVRALLDTGATQYSIQQELANLLNLEKTNTDNVGYLAISGPIEVNVYKMEFRLNGMMNFRFTDEFHSMPFNFVYQIIIGTDFLKRCKLFHIDYQIQKWTIEL